MPASTIGVGRRAGSGEDEGVELNYPDLNPDEWKAVLARLLRQATFGVAAGHWSGHRPDSGWIRRKSEELAHTTLKKIFNGERRWNRDKYPDFIDFAKAAVDSEVSNAKTHSSNTVKSRAIDEHDPTLVALESFGASTSSPEQESVDQDFKEAILRTVEDDGQVRDLVEVVLELGIVKRSELMEYLEMDGKSYDTLRRRAQRRLTAAGYSLKVLLGLVAWEDCK